ncbi:hypothetical protein SSAG_00843 [Streptomyces sp. Mg1]|nr:hypothetical protein SSAG_00843 [Streptomyces sp. Mg1]
MLPSGTAGRTLKPRVWGHAVARVAPDSQTGKLRHPLVRAICHGGRGRIRQAYREGHRTGWPPWAWSSAAKAEEGQWLGEIEGIDMTLTFVRTKQTDATRTARKTTVLLACPALPSG